MIKIKKYLVVIVILISIISGSIINSQNKIVENNIKTYELKANQTMYEGKDIPYGTYILKAEEESLSVNINEDDGTSVLSMILLSNNGKKYIETEIAIPKYTNITVDKNATLTNN